MEGIITDFFTLSYDDKELRVLQLHKNKVVSFGSTSLPSGIVVNGKIVRKQVFAENIKLLNSKTKPQKITTNNVALYVPESKVFLKILEIPKINPDKITDAIGWQAESILPIAPENLYYDWQKIAETTDNKIKLLITACPKDVIDLLLESLNNYGFNVISIKSKAGALSGLFANAPHKPVMIINIEPEETSLIIAKNSIARVSTSLPTIKDSATLLQKISQTIDFYKERKGEKEISSIILLGNSDIQLKEKIFNTTKIATKFGHYHSNVIKTLKNEKENYFINLALAYNPYLGVNLLPEPYKKNLMVNEVNKKIDNISKLMIAVSAIIILGLFLFWWLLIFDLNKTNSVLASTKLSQISPKTQIIENEIIDLNKRMVRIEALINQRSKYNEVLEKISQITQDGVMIKSFSLDKESEKFKLSGSAQTRQQFLQFKDKFYQSGHFKNISVPLKSLEKPQDINFEMSFNYKW